MTEVYDLESLSNLFTYTGYNYKQDKWNVFIICDWQNEYKELKEHLDTLKIMIGFNNEKYDYPLLHYFINHYNDYKTWTGDQIARDLYLKSQEIIGMEFSSIVDKNKFIFQIDLFQIWGFANKARRCSLKDLEFSMRMDNVEEMPLNHTHTCTSEDVPLILEYNKNDVWATYLFYKITRGETNDPMYKGKDKLKLRFDLKKKFGLPCVNYPDIKIGEQLILDLYCKKTGVNKYELKKKGGTSRDKICLGECIPPWANFKTKEFNDLKKKFQDTCVNSIKGEFSASVFFHGIKIDYGTGGAHASCKSGIYMSNDNWMIVSSDISSLYPSIAIQLGIYPEHLGKDFIDIYNEDIVSVRLAEKKKPKKERNAVIVDGFKLAANSIYGKSAEENSILYDPLYTMKTTVGGQMFISLWIEKLTLAVPEIKFLLANTDGTEYLIPRDKLDLIKEVNKEMTKFTGLNIESNIYSKIIIRDVNNYIAQYETGEYKAKGCFEVDKELYKDSSMRIVSLALKEYFLNGIPVQDTIMNHKDIYDFCLRLKTNAGTTPFYREIKDGSIVDTKLNRTTRYYISNNGGQLYKDFGKGRQSGVNVGYTVTLFNKYENKEDYNINYGFYITEANKIVNSIVNKQLYLFNFEH